MSKLPDFKHYLIENLTSDEEAELKKLGLAASDPKLSMTIPQFVKILRAEYKEYLDGISHSDDWMSMMDFYSENARGYEKEYGISRNRDTDEWEYTMRNTNYRDDFDEDDEDF